MYPMRAVLILLALVPGYVFAQRHGGGIAQNRKQANPILNIDSLATKKWSYITLSDLLKMNRVSINILGRKTNQVNRYEGVSLSHLIAAASGYRLEIFQRSLAFKEKLAISSADLDMESDVISADTVNGKRLGADYPFCLVAKNRHGDSIVVDKLSYIKVDPAHVNFLVPLRVNEVEQGGTNRIGY